LDLIFLLEQFLYDVILVDAKRLLKLLIVNFLFILLPEMLLEVHELQFGDLIILKLAFKLILLLLEIPDLLI